VEGLNLEGVCDNPGCQAYKIAIIDPVGFGSFSLKTDKVNSNVPIHQVCCFTSLTTCPDQPKELSI